MNEEELKQSLENCCVAMNDALDEIIRKLQESLPTYQTLTEMYYVRTPEEIKKQIKHEKNPMRLKQLNRELNESYKVYRKKVKSNDHNEA